MNQQTWRKIYNEVAAKDAEDETVQELIQDERLMDDAEDVEVDALLSLQHGYLTSGDEPIIRRLIQPIRRRAPIELINSVLLESDEDITKLNANGGMEINLTSNNEISSSTVKTINPAIALQDVLQARADLDSFLSGNLKIKEREEGGDISQQDAVSRSSNYLAATTSTTTQRRKINALSDSGILSRQPANSRGGPFAAPPGYFPCADAIGKSIIPKIERSLLRANVFSDYISILGGVVFPFSSVSQTGQDNEGTEFSQLYDISDDNIENTDNNVVIPSSNTNSEQLKQNEDSVSILSPSTTIPSIPPTLPLTSIRAGRSIPFSLLNRIEVTESLKSGQSRDFLSQIANSYTEKMTNTTNTIDIQSTSSSVSSSLGISTASPHGSWNSNVHKESSHKRIQTDNKHPLSAPLIGSEDLLAVSSQKEVETSASNETYILNKGTSVLYSPEFIKLSKAMAEAIMDDDASISPIAAKDAVARILAISSRSRCAKLAYEAVVRLSVNPNFSLILPDSSFVPPISVTFKTGYHGSTFGPGATINVPLVFQLRSIVESLGDKKEQLIGRIFAMVVHDIAFESIQSSQRDEQHYSHIYSVQSLNLYVASGRVDMLFFMGNDSDSSRDLLSALEPSILRVMLAAPLPEHAIKAMNLAVEQIARRAKDRSLAGMLTKKRRRRGSADNAQRVDLHGTVVVGGTVGTFPVDSVLDFGGVSSGEQKGEGGRSGINEGSDDSKSNTIKLGDIDHSSSLSIVRTNISSAEPAIRANNDNKVSLRPINTLPAILRDSFAHDELEEEGILSALDIACGHRLLRSFWRGELLRKKQSPSQGKVKSNKDLSSASDKYSDVALSTPVSSSAYTQVYAWGRGESGLLGIGDNETDYCTPIPLPFASEVGTWRVKAIACGSFHTCAVTDVGLLYSWGNGGDGQLGHGDTLSCSSPRLVDFFGFQHPLRVLSVAAGSDAAGSHTVVVASGQLAEEEIDPKSTDIDDSDFIDVGQSDSDPLGDVGKKGGSTVAALGRVFAWGFGTAVGAPSINNVLQPQLVRASASDIYAERHGGVLTVSAGGGFTLALTRSGAVYSWGKYANGRLGLGVPPLSRSRGYGGSKQYVRYSLTPSRVTSGWIARDEDIEILSSEEEEVEEEEEEEEEDVASTTINEKIDSKSEIKDGTQGTKPIRPSLLVSAVANAYGKPTRPIRAIACGEAHALAIDAFGLLWSWGRGQLGQLGLGVVADVLAPKMVRVRKRGGISTDVAGSSSASVAGGAAEDSMSTAGSMDDEGKVAAGSVNSSLSEFNGVGSSSLGSSNSGPLLPVRFVSIACGVSHSLAIALDGSLYTWGGGGFPALGHGDQHLRTTMYDTPMSVIARMQHRQKKELLKLQRDRLSTLQRLEAESASSEAKRLKQELRRDEKNLKRHFLTRFLPMRLIELFGVNAEARLKAEEAAKKAGESVDDDDNLSDDEDDDEDEDNDEKASSRALRRAERLKAASEAKPAHLRLGWKYPWLSPRRVRVFDGSITSMRVSKAGGGSTFSWAVTDTGQLFVWGENSNGVLGSGSTNSAYVEILPRLVGVSTHRGGLAEPSLASGVGGPASGAQRMRLAGENVMCVGSGHGHIVAASANSFVGANLRAALSLGPVALISEDASSRTSEKKRFKRALSRNRVDNAEGEDDDDDMSIYSMNQSISASFVSGIYVRGYDTVLFVDGRSIKAHRAILAARSSVLAARLELETRPGKKTSKLFISDMSFTTAVLLIEFIYTDDLTVPLTPQGAALNQLADAANKYQVIRLENICKVMIDAPVTYWMRQLHVKDSDFLTSVDKDEINDQQETLHDTEDSSTVAPNQLMSPPLARERQMQAAFDLADHKGENLLPMHLLVNGLLDPKWADMYLVAEGWRFPVHAAIICASCEYFRVLLRGSMEGDEVSDKDRFGDAMTDINGSVTGSLLSAAEDGEPIEVEVPDSAMTLSRLIFFLYTGWLAPLPSSSVDANTKGLIPGVPIFCERIQTDESNFTRTGSPMPEHLSQENKSQEAIPIQQRPSVKSTWTTSSQMLLDLVAADRYGLDHLKILIESAFDVSPSQVAQVLELSSLVPAPRIRECALVSALSNMTAVTSSKGYKNMQYRSPRLVGEILDRALSRNVDFFGVLSDSTSTSTVLARLASKKRDDPLSKLFKRTVFPWKPLVFLAVFFFAFITFAEYNTSMSALVPVVNVLVLVSIGIGLYQGWISI
jgi:alpha-tubulin suppressor-like RCC1 family protein